MSSGSTVRLWGLLVFIRYSDRYLPCASEALEREERPSLSLSLSLSLGTRLVSQVSTYGEPVKPTYAASCGRCMWRDPETEWSFSRRIDSATKAVSLLLAHWMRVGLLFVSDHLNFVFLTELGLKVCVHWKMTR